MPTFTGFTTISDLIDGQTGATIVASNEAHTFSAGADGAISDLSGFSTTFTVYSGTTAFTYTDSTPSANNTYTIGTITFTSGADLNSSVSASGEVTISDANSVSTGFVDANTSIDNVTMTVPITVRIGGSNITYNRGISLAKAKGGSAKTVRVSASRQNIDFAYDASSPKASQNDIVITAEFINFLGTETDATWSYFVDGGSTETTITSSSNATISGTGNSTLTLTSAGIDNHLGDSGSSVTYRCSRDSREDRVTVFKLEDAEGGYAVIVETIAGQRVFKNSPTYSSSDASTYVDLEVKLYRAGTEITSGLTYQWKKDGSNITSTDVTQSDVGSDYGTTSAKIRLTAADIDDNESDEISCDVTF